MGTISGILKDADEWQDASESNAVEAKKLRLAHEPRLEEALVFWLDTYTSNGGTFTDRLLQMQAQAIAVEMGNDNLR